MVDILILLILGLLVYEVGKYVERNHKQARNHNSNKITHGGNVYTFYHLPKFDDGIIGEPVQKVEKALINIGYKVDVTTDLIEFGQQSTTNDTIQLFTNKSNLVQSWKFK